MHSSTCDTEAPRLDGAGVLVAITALVAEGRISNKLDTKKRGFSEGPHCAFSKASQGHICSSDNQLCIKYEKINSYILSLWQRNIPLCIEVLLVPKCCCENDLVCNVSSSPDQIDSAILLEQWNFTILHRRAHHSTNITVNQLLNAIRSQLHFSQISAWNSSPDESIRKNFLNKSILYCLTIPGETFGCTKFSSSSHNHNFPTADIGNGIELKVSLSNLPRTAEIPHIKCSKCNVPMTVVTDNNISVLDDRMQMSCTLKGKHRCEDLEEFENGCGHLRYNKKFANISCTCKHTKTTNDFTSMPSTSKSIFNQLNYLKCCMNHTGVAYADKKCDINNKCSNGDEGKSEKEEAAGTKMVQDLELSRREFEEVLHLLKRSGPSKPQKQIDLGKQSQGDKLLDAILRSSKVQSDEGSQDAGCPVRIQQPMAPANATNTVQCMRALSEAMYNNISTTGINFKRKCMHKLGVTGPHTNDTNACVKHSVHDGDNKSICDNKNDYIISDKLRVGENHNIYIDTNCDKVKRKKTDFNKIRDISNVFNLEYLEKRQKVKVKQRITFDDHEPSCDAQNNEDTSAQPCEAEHTSHTQNGLDFGDVDGGERKDKCNKDVHFGIPSALEQAKFRKSLDNAASMVFHSRTGLPLTSSPAPVRRGKSCFDFDSSINSVSAIRSALFSLQNFSTDDDSESDCSIVSPCSPDATNGLKHRDISPLKYHRKGQSSGLLGSFEESVLNGRLEPVSTVHGFTAELGASGSFCPRHVVLPVTVFFYTLGDNDKVSTPYLGHINLGKKGYNIPKSGTIQVTLFNPLGTVVKMFVIMYDLSDMPVSSQTFIRQRTLYMPANCEDKNLEWSQKWLRYLIHLRFMSSKSGRIYLHSDIRMIICRKSDLDTATAHGFDMSYELRSFTHSPSNPKFSPRK